ncbi:MAG: hypothetical protein JXA30_22970 [Deltaproteobacteria bacterium]|nr:hypothetical protein [Deltaproteobacteria bacterium]
MSLINVLQEINRDIGNCYFVSCFDLETGLPIGNVSDQHHIDGESIGIAFGNMLDLIVHAQKHARNDTVRTLVGGFKEFILETTKSAFFVISPNRETNMAIAIGVPKQVKLGMVRMCVKKHFQSLLGSLKEIS